VAINYPPKNSCDTAKVLTYAGNNKLDIFQIWKRPIFQPKKKYRRAARLEPWDMTSRSNFLKCRDKEKILCLLFYPPKKYWKQLQRETPTLFSNHVFTRELWFVVLVVLESCWKRHCIELVYGSQVRTGRIFSLVFIFRRVLGHFSTIYFSRWCSKDLSRKVMPQAESVRNIMQIGATSHFIWKYFLS
jgi:hypothetical protein